MTAETTSALERDSNHPGGEIDRGESSSSSSSSSSPTSCDDRFFFRSRYDAIRKELRLLSDLHRMRERGGFDAGGNAVVTTTTRRGPGRTRTLKHHHMEDFSDDDYTRYIRGSPPDGSTVHNDSSSSSSSSVTLRRFRLFNKFARSVCRAKAIARKEIFEAWATALYVHETFLSSRALCLSMTFPSSSGSNGQKRRRTPVKRFADLACSHGLLSWALLLLASSEEEEEDFRQEPQDQQTCGGDESSAKRKLMTAVCIDIAMPKSSETLAEIFFSDYPQFSDDGSGSPSPPPQPATANGNDTESPPSIRSGPHPRWDYVEGPVENLVSHESTLLMGIHACGRLSDTIIDQALSSNAPLALVPCCHSKKILTASQAEGFAALLSSHKHDNKRDNDKSLPLPPPIPSYSLADFMDSIRKQRLIDAGYTVEEIWIPEEFTPKNRILLAIPPERRAEVLPPSPFTKAKPKLFARMPFFEIPLEDSQEARAALREVAGRGPADKRKIDAHPAPAICVSVWLPEPSHGSAKQGGGDGDGGPSHTGSASTEATASDRDDTAEVFSALALQKVMEDENVSANRKNANPSSSGPTVRVVDADHKPYSNPIDGRRSKTLRVHYLDCRNNKAEAKARHKRLKEVTIPRHFPTVTIRGL